MDSLSTFISEGKIYICKGTCLAGVSCSGFNTPTPPGPLSTLGEMGNELGVPLSNVCVFPYPKLTYMSEFTEI